MTYYLLNKQYPSEEARQQAAEAHPLFNWFHHWLCNGLGGPPPMSYQHYRDLFEGFVGGHGLSLNVQVECLPRQRTGGLKCWH